MRHNPNSGDVVYFVLAPGAGLIKIGSAVCVHKRMLTLRTMSPVALELLGVIMVPPGSTLERRLHHRFAKLRAHGEWFRNDTLLVDFIKEATTEPPPVAELSVAGRRAANAKRRQQRRAQYNRVSTPESRTEIGRAGAAARIGACKSRRPSPMTANPPSAVF